MISDFLQKPLPRFLNSPAAAADANNNWQR